MTNRTAVQAIAVGTLLLAGLATLEVRLFFPRVKVAKNTQTVNHDYEPAKPAAPKADYGPPLPRGCKRYCGGGGTILIGG